MIFLPVAAVFLLTPLREGRPDWHRTANHCNCISTHAPAGGATGDVDAAGGYADRFLLTPLREGRPEPVRRVKSSGDFYSRPCWRGDGAELSHRRYPHISTHAPAGGATYTGLNDFRQKLHFYSRPCGRGDPTRFSRPNSSSSISTHAPAGGATPVARVRWLNLRSISTHAPAGGATRACVIIFVPVAFLLTPLREGRLHDPGADQDVRPISTHAPAGGATRCNRDDRGHGHISTHAPAGGAT